MGSLSEFIDYINRDKVPDKYQEKFTYSHITITDQVKKARRLYRKQLRDDMNQVEKAGNNGTPTKSNG